jgi:DHA2 family methylenomycin A resistance protein-like MFS transporter
MDAAPDESGGIASGIINAARQVGSVIGIALLGALVARRTTFISGLHVAVIIGGAAFLLGCGLAIAAVGGRRERPAGAGSSASGRIIPPRPASVRSRRDN